MDCIKTRLFAILLFMSIFCAGSTLVAASTNLTRLRNVVVSSAPVATMLAVLKIQMSGLPDASPFYRYHFDEALRQYGVNNPEKIVLKNDPSMKAETCGAATFFGVKINEKQLDRCSIEERIHTCYHEAAHIALGHVYDGLKVAAGGICLLNLETNNPLLKTAFMCSGLLGTAKVGSMLTTPWLKSPTEKESDAMAMEYLIKTGKCDIVEALSQQYQNQYDEDKDILDFFQSQLKEHLDSLQKSKVSLSNLTKEEWAFLKNKLAKNGSFLLHIAEKNIKRLLSSDLKKENEKLQNSVKESMERLTRWKVLSEQAYAKVRRENVVRSKL